MHFKYDENKIQKFLCKIEYNKNRRFYVIYSVKKIYTDNILI